MNNDKPRDEAFRELVGQAIGEASMCWSELPTGVFESTKAKALFDRILTAAQSTIAERDAEIERLRKHRDERFVPTMKQITGDLKVANELIDVLADVLTTLKLEASAFVKNANPADHGHTNINVMEHWIEKSDEALAKHILYWEGK